ncbi:hypothetical protein ACSDR0_50965, partial [Streptosporangium sp. G11]|uniref:hypothetical protein n=1 Tax=Streptosporangium sp. G11 TaxID=3436926 RepID=UPI003EC154C1
RDALPERPVGMRVNQADSTELGVHQAAIDFQGGTGTAELMEAVAILKRLNEGGGRKVPEGAPTSPWPPSTRPGPR